MTHDAPVYVDPRFLSAEACRRIRAAMDLGREEPAEVLGSEARLERTVRRVSSIEVDAATLADVEARLEATREPIEACHACRLSGREGVGFLRYQPGDFYKPHRDRGVVESWPGAARRRISIVVFLNSAGREDAAADFTGGTLRLLDGSPDPMAIVPEQGCLVAFSSSRLHEVTRVHLGTRDTLVDWFY
jgi:predicted 2-oxoglutarate/Fe(II)-dependent dioxygenase YbiX